jgi:hypothetical protein
MARFKPVAFMPALLLFLFFQIPTFAQDQSTANTHYYYRFENPKFLISKLEIEFDGAGQGTIKFTEQDHDDVENKFTLNSATVTSFAAAFDELDFLKKKEKFQTPKDYSHMGTATVKFRRGEEEYETTFNYTESKQMLDLWNKFRSVENQEYSFFKLEVALRYQPLDTPAQLKWIESMLKDKKIAEPARFLPILNQIAGSDQMLTIARNQAKKMIELIQLGKK